MQHFSSLLKKSQCDYLEVCQKKKKKNCSDLKESCIHVLRRKATRKYARMENIEKMISYFLVIIIKEARNNDIVLQFFIFPT